MLVLLEQVTRGEDGERAGDDVVGITALAEAGEEGGCKGGSVGRGSVGGAVVDEGEAVEEGAEGGRELNDRAYVWRRSAYDALAEWRGLPHRWS